MTNNLVRLLRIVLLMLIVFTISIRGGSFFGINPFVSKEKVDVATFTSHEVKSLFSTYTSLDLVDLGTYKVYQSGELIGTLLNSSPVSDSIVGFVNRVPLLVGIDQSNHIIGLRLLKNGESKDFVENITKRGVLNFWDGRSISSALNSQPDAVSGATFTTNGIKNTFNHTLATYAKEASVNQATTTTWTILKWLAAVAVLIFALSMFWMPQRLIRYRNWLLLLNIVVIGFWVGELLSLQSIYHWFIHGPQLHTRWFITLVILLAFILPLVTGKSFYCTYVCPYGSMQELANKLNKGRFKVNLPKGLKQRLPFLRELIFGVIVLLLAVGVLFDLTNIEPFSAFMLQTASTAILILAALFIVISFFIPKAWCRYFCPTGELLDIIRKLLTIK